MVDANKPGKGPVPDCTKVAGGRRSGRPRRPPAMVAEERERLIAAVSRAYARYGYLETTVERVLVDAAISRPKFYRYFTNLDEVLDLIVARANARLFALIGERVASCAEPEQKIAAAIDAYLDWGVETGPLVTVMYAETNLERSPVYRHRLITLQGAAALLARESTALGRRSVDPLLHEALVNVIEYVGSRTFNTSTSDMERRRRRAVILRIVMASLAEPDEQTLIPPLPETS